MASNFIFTKLGVTIRQPDQKEKLKFATHVLVFGQEKWVIRNIANAYPHVERIYVSYSEKPWSYNPNARHQYKNNFDLDQIRNSCYADKVTIIEGEWATEEDQRNACANRADQDGMDYLIIHDADEFYKHEEWPKILAYITENSDYDYYKIAWYCFWKSFKYVLLDSSGSEIAGYPEFCINLKRGVRFASKRRPNKTNNLSIVPSVGICYHGSYVLTNEELLQKINTWGHTNDFNKEYWYNNIWLKWTPEMRNLHLVSPSAWLGAAPFSGKLPDEIADME